jgi:hypothetical protein
MNKLQRLAALYAVAMAGMGRDNLYDIPRVQPSKPQKTVPNGMRKFTYSDGFQCWALNQKNADKKHNKWTK